MPIRRSLVEMREKKGGDGIRESREGIEGGVEGGSRRRKSREGME